MRPLLRNGLVAGACGGLALAIVLAALGEGPAADHEMFSRGTQQAGGIVGALVYGALLGLVFAVVFVAARHRLPGRTDPRRALLMALAGWTAVVFVPFVLYPPNPPGVGDPATIDQRTVAYIVALAWGVVSVVAATGGGRELHRRGWQEPAQIAGGVISFVALVALAAFLLPASTSVRALPADLVWPFRLTSLAGTSACWLTLGVVFGALTARVADREVVRV